MKKKWIKAGRIYIDGSSVVIEGQRYFAPLSDEQMIAAGYEEYIPPTPEPEPTPELTPIPEPTPEEQLEEARHEKLMQINEYDHTTVNSFTINGGEMWLTVEERQQIATQISANEAIGRESMTRWFGGQEYTFTLPVWKQMLVALEVYAGDALNVTEAHKVAVEAMDNIEDIQSFDITQGYPSRLVF